MCRRVDNIVVSCVGHVLILEVIGCVLAFPCVLFDPPRGPAMEAMDGGDGWRQWSTNNGGRDDEDILWGMCYVLEVLLVCCN